MQPFDALTMRAALQEARPLLVNRKVEKIYQLGRDEIILAFRLKAGSGHFLLSAQASFGRLCMINLPQLPKHVNPPAFCQALRKHLTGAMLVDIQQIPGERVADLNFACVDELGTPSKKVLTAEIMGRHSNLIFWDKDTQKIVAASHVVTQEMSRQREVAAGLLYVRPPQQDKASIFDVGERQFRELFERLRRGELPVLASSLHSSDKHSAQSSATVTDDSARAPASISTLEQWLISSFSGIGRHLAEELVVATGLQNDLTSATSAESDAESKLWERISEMQRTGHYKPAMKLDLTRYTVLSWWPEIEQDDTGNEWKKFPAVNDMVEDYFRTLQLREQMQQLRDRIRSELRSESEKVEGRLTAALKQLDTARDLQDLKIAGDLILANLQNIRPGQTELVCENLYTSVPANGDTAGSTGNGGNAGEPGGGKGKINISLNPNLSASQNAQHYYRQFAKARVRQKAAGVAQSDAAARMEILKQHIIALEQAKAPEELNRLKELILDRGRKAADQAQQQRSGSGGGPAGRTAGGGSGASQGTKPPQQGSANSNRGPRLISIKSTEGWLIYIGRNRNENDVLLSKLAQPQDIWLHVQGQEGAHVLIKNPNKQDPPLSTLKEAAQLAARFSRVSFGSKVRVIYTHVKHVKKLGKDKPGLVRYENEKTLEVDTSTPLPPSLRKLFSK